MTHVKIRSLIAMLALLALLATACGGETETATETVDGGEEAEQVAEAETTTEAPETSTEAPETSTEAPADAEEEEDSLTTVDGMEIYEAKCARCHSSDGSGGRGSNIQGISEEQPETTGGIEFVNNGGDGMPSFADELSPEQIESVINYVWETF